MRGKSVFPEWLGSGFWRWVKSYRKKHGLSVLVRKLSQCRRAFDLHSIREPPDADSCGYKKTSSPVEVYGKTVNILLAGLWAQALILG